MSIILDPYAVPEKGKVELKIERSFEIKVTAEEARRRVNHWLYDEVSLLISAGEPSLVVGEGVVWRVPAWISFPHTGRAGLVGTVDVDVTSGTMNNTSDCKAEIERQAEAVAARQSPYHPKKLPEQYSNLKIPPAPKLRILENGTLTPTQKKHP